MSINYDQSLYTKRKNAETRAAIDAVNAEAHALGFGDTDAEWGLQDTLRKKMAYLDAWKSQNLPRP